MAARVGFHKPRKTDIRNAKSPLMVNYIRQQSVGDVLRNMFAIYGKGSGALGRLFVASLLQAPARAAGRGRCRSLQTTAGRIGEGAGPQRGAAVAANRARPRPRAPPLRDSARVRRVDPARAGA